MHSSVFEWEQSLDIESIKSSHNAKSYQIRKREVKKLNEKTREIWEVNETEASWNSENGDELKNERWWLTRRK